MPWMQLTICAHGNPDHLLSSIEMSIKEWNEGIRSLVYQLPLEVITNDQSNLDIEDDIIFVDLVLHEGSYKL